MEEDFNQLRLINKRMVETPFQQGWQFRLDIDDDNAPGDLDIYIREISYGPVEIETDQVKAGGLTLTYPTGTQPVTLTMTVRDNEDRRVYDWLMDWRNAVVNSDGTVNLPSDYVRKADRVSLSDDRIQDTWYVYPIRIGDITESTDSEGFLEFPATFVQFRSIGKQQI